MQDRYFLFRCRSVFYCQDRITGQQKKSPDARQD
jgi:hypothetical protein